MNTTAQTTAIEQVEKVRNRLAFFLVIAFVSSLPFLLFKVIPTENKEIIVYILGQLSGMATTALGFYFVNKVGQDAADAKRADNTGKALDAITTVAQNTGTGGAADPNALRPGDTVTLNEPPPGTPPPGSVPDPEDTELNEGERT